MWDPLFILYVGMQLQYTMMLSADSIQSQQQTDVTCRRDVETSI
jgi:hypothetical protein